jgi:hypothetical protein
MELGALLDEVLLLLERLSANAALELALPHDFVHFLLELRVRLRHRLFVHEPGPGT